MEKTVKLGIIGDFDADKISHIETENSIKHVEEHFDFKVNRNWIPTEELENIKQFQNLSEYDAFWCGPGGPYRSLSGALNAIRFCREGTRPFLGT